MPSFYGSRQLPLTPPDFNTGYQSNGCAGMQYPQHSYAPALGLGRQDESGYGYNGRYGQAQAPAHMQSSMLHPHQQQQQGFNHTSLNRYPESVVGLPLPPVRSFDQTLPPAPGPQHQRAQDYRSRYEQQQQQPKAKEEKPVGGVSATLDYDMDDMTDFVSDMAVKIVQPGKPSHDGFRNWVHGVLCATRLPSATIILSLHYLSRRMTYLSGSRQGSPHEGQIYRLLTVALILGSKFLDDNTFINRSWADVSLIDVKILNQMELEWLTSNDFRLHRPEDLTGFKEWESCWRDYESQALARSARSLKLSPLDTSVQHHAQVPKTFSPRSTQSAFPPPSAQDYSARPQQTHYHTPSYAPYDPWVIPRSATTETSPASAPHTGPTTPEYYGGPGTWAPLDSGAYSFSRPYGFTPLPQPRAQSHSQQPHAPAAAYTPFTPQYHHNVWTAHPLHCNCGHCNRNHMNYFMAPTFGQQIVAA